MDEEKEVQDIDSIAPVKKKADSMATLKPVDSIAMTAKVTKPTYHEKPAQTTKPAASEPVRKPARSASEAVADLPKKGEVLRSIQPEQLTKPKKEKKSATNKILSMFNGEPKSNAEINDTEFRKKFREAVKETKPADRHSLEKIFKRITLVFGVLLLCFVLYYYSRNSGVYKEMFSSADDSYCKFDRAGFVCLDSFLQDNNSSVTMKNSFPHNVQIVSVKAGTCVTFPFNGTLKNLDTATYNFTNCNTKGFFNEELEVVYINLISGLPRLEKGTLRHTYGINSISRMFT